MKKKLGISFTKTNFQYYWNWFTSVDLKGDVELLELNFEKNNSEDIYQCDGFILTGGVDTHPSFYNGKTDYNNSPSVFQVERDLFEEKIYRYSQLHKLPVLGICRGMQLINVLEGGKLIQDLDNGNERHRKEDADKIHSIIAEDHSLLHKVSGSLSGSVNSAHHQAIDPDGIGDNLIVNAYDDDEKIIEGLEFKNKKDKAFMLCVQWHPERIQDKEANPFSENLKKEFLAALRQTATKKLSVINPATEEIIAELNEDTNDTLRENFESLKTAQKDWQKVSLKYRIEIIKKLSDLLEKNVEQLAATLTSEVGKPLQQSRNEIKGAGARIKWLTENAEKYLSDEIMSNGNGLEEKISYEPLGVVCNISAWNYPYLVGINVFVPA
ncbi:MAG TPA: aldehyde dehydrogenase family protein, partial [Chitinophagaceae bacterium]